MDSYRLIITIILAIGLGFSTIANAPFIGMDWQITGLSY